VENEQSSSIDNKQAPQYYSLSDSNDNCFVAGLRADIRLNGNKIGSMGVIHPDVLSKFGIANPCSSLEIEIEHFL